MKDLMVVGRAGLALACVAALGLSGCTNSVGGTGANISSSAASTVTQTMVTDAPADQVLALAMDVDSIVLTDAAGSSTTVLSTPTKVEASHLDAVVEPLLPPMKVPQDTYVSATITVANPVVVYVDTATKTVVKTSATLTAPTTTVTFNSPIVVGPHAAPIVFDVMVGPSVSISGSTVTVTPTFDVRQINLNGPPTNGNNGRVNDVRGMVVSVSGTDLVVSAPNGNQLTIATDSNTVLQGFNALSDLTAGEIVDVDVEQTSSGGLLAKRIHLDARTAQSLFVGPVTAVTGTPVTSFTQLVRQPVGPSATANSTATSYTVTLGSGATFGIGPQATAVPPLPFTATFSASTIFAGQNVSVVASAVSGTSVTASNVMLVPQTVGGTIAAIGTSGGFTTYTVTLPAGSALGTLTGASSVVVYVNSSAQMMNSGQLAVGSNARFNGLLFNDAGTLRMVAGECHDAPGNPPTQRH